MMDDDKMNACQVLSQSERVSEFRKDFVCMNDNLHEGLQEHPQVLILYVAMVIFVMVFLKLVTRKPRKTGSDG
jgi:hypothetical protein